MGTDGLDEAEGTQGDVARARGEGGELDASAGGAVGLVAQGDVAGEGAGGVGPVDEGGVRGRLEEEDDEEGWWAEAEETHEENVGVE